MKSTRFVLTAFLLIWTRVSIAQMQDSNWYFGVEGAGLDFNQCSPQVVQDGLPDHVTFEGAASISDPSTGELLFYANGWNIYNRERQLMSNGSVGITNSLAQIVIVPWPGTLTKYFVVMPELQGGIEWMPAHQIAYKLHYAIVDMALDGGAGGVESKYHILPQATHCEFITAVRNSNQVDFWLIGHEFNSNRFFVYSVTELGIAAVPTFYPVGPFVSTPQAGTPNSSHFDAVGSMRANSRGTHLAFTTMYNAITCVVDFDPTTGVVSAPMELDIDGSSYGVSFSNDGSKLYVGARDQGTDFIHGRLLQFDLDGEDQVAVQASMTSIHSYPGSGGYVTLKLGPDGGLYVAKTGTPTDEYVAVVNEPDQLGPLCGYVEDYLYVGLSGSWSLDNSIEYGHDCRTVQLEELPSHDPCDQVEISIANRTAQLKWGATNMFDQIELRSLDGRISHGLSISTGQREARISLAAEAVGIYMLSLRGPTCNYTQKVLLSK